MRSVDIRSMRTSVQYKGAALAGGAQAFFVSGRFSRASGHFGECCVVFVTRADRPAVDTADSRKGPRHETVLLLDARGHAGRRCLWRDRCALARTARRCSDGLARGAGRRTGAACRATFARRLQTRYGLARSEMRRAHVWRAARQSHIARFATESAAVVTCPRTRKRASFLTDSQGRYAP